MKSRDFRWIIPGVVILPVLLFASCKSPSAGITVHSHPGMKITVNSLMVGDRMEIIEYNAAKVDDYLRVQLKGKNVTQSDYHFEYKYVWYDAAGFEVSTPMSSWIPVSVSAKEEVNMGAVAPTKKVEDFVFTVRFPKGMERWE